MFHMLYTSVTAPFWILTVPLLWTSEIVHGPLYAFCPYLVDCSFFISTRSFILYSCGTHFLFSLRLLCSINRCLRVLISRQLASNVRFIIASRPNETRRGKPVYPSFNRKKSDFLINFFLRVNRTSSYVEAIYLRYSLHVESTMVGRLYNNLPTYIAKRTQY